MVSGKRRSRAVIRSFILVLAVGAPGTELCAQEAGSSASERAVEGKGARQDDELATLFQALRAARDEASARRIEDRIWRRWMQAPDARTAELVREAMARREVYDFAGARSLLDEAVARSPNYAEVYNQRGFILFLQDDLDGALGDVDRAIALEPRHFAAMAGRALILMRQGRHRLAQKQLREAVTIDPYLKERNLLVGGEPEPGSPGIEL
ncbi:tetratricopeptide repeat protein [Jiella mangrovi]|uniref:Tetratricopeptide repeat protein n=1 Tax=Jiella mangrovi TaxID=2821407 RepID=A0ABS4BIL3_9HYPH|nr:hypothetical protein [Jiella mangrovi]MBP0616607.1 hypothetical protein [Jiella mangrovi]